MRTFNRADWEASLQAWQDGHFSDEWRPFRHEAAMRGLIYPPTGTEWDSWEDARPSQRAILVRAIRETPTLLHAAIASARSWSEVIEYVVRARDEWRAELTSRERDAERERDREANPAEAVLSLRAIVDRIRDS